MRRASSGRTRRRRAFEGGGNELPIRETPFIYFKRAYLLLPSDALNAWNALLPQMPCATHMSSPDVPEMSGT